MMGNVRPGHVFRLAMAVVGLGLIVVIIALNWSDRMVLPAGRYSNASSGPMVDVTEQQTAAIVQRGNGQVRVRLSSRTDSAEVVIPRGRIGGEGEPYIKAGMVTTMGRANRWLLIAGLVLVGLTFPLQALRWLILMRCRGLRVRFGWALGLTMVGQFFNVSMPGATGGDLVKAYYAASKPGQRAAAVMSVVIDRTVGLVGVVLLGGLAGLWALDKPAIRWAMLGIWLGLGLFLLLTWLYVCPAVRRRIGIRGAIEKVPGGRFIERLDQAAVAYRDHRGTVAVAVLLSLPIHSALVGSIILAGKALGVEQSVMYLATLIPLVLVLASVPISPAGLGVMEGAGVLLIPAPPTQVLGMMLIFRLYQTAYALIGWPTMLRGNITRHAPEMSMSPPTSAESTNF